jgi:hypothetical protein
MKWDETQTARLTPIIAHTNTEKVTKPPVRISRSPLSFVAVFGSGIRDGQKSVPVTYGSRISNGQKAPE